MSRLTTAETELMLRDARQALNSFQRKNYFAIFRGRATPTTAATAALSNSYGPSSRKAFDSGTRCGLPRPQGLGRARSCPSVFVHQVSLRPPSPWTRTSLQLFSQPPAQHPAPCQTGHCGPAREPARRPGRPLQMAQRLRPAEARPHHLRTAPYRPDFPGCQNGRQRPHRRNLPGRPAGKPLKT